jgi:two-component sensor histidine kinase
VVPNIALLLFVPGENRNRAPLFAKQLFIRPTYCAIQRSAKAVTRSLQEQRSLKLARCFSKNVLTDAIFARFAPPTFAGEDQVGHDKLRKKKNQQIQKSLGGPPCYNFVCSRTQRHVEAEVAMIGDLQSTVKPINRSLLYVTELLHRIQNEYMNAISFTSMVATRSATPEAKAALSQVVDHLHALAKAHRILRPPSPGELVDLTAELTQLCRAIVSRDLDQRGITMHLTVAGSLLLDSDQCWRANLILTELITNASRHAFDARGGRIFGRCHDRMRMDRMPSKRRRLSGSDT